MTRSKWSTASAATRRVPHIVGDLLDLSREREGAGIPIDPKPTDLRAVCRQIIDELEAVTRDQRITFDCDVDATGAWDEHRVVQAIFEPFRSGRHAASRGEGLGLGLFIAMAIARAHGGGLEVNSAGDQTMFRLVLPRQTPSAAAATVWRIHSVPMRPASGS